MSFARVRNHVRGSARIRRCRPSRLSLCIFKRREPQLHRFRTSNSSSPFHLTTLTTALASNCLPTRPPLWRLLSTLIPRSPPPLPHEIAPGARLPSTPLCLRIRATPLPAATSTALLRLLATSGYVQSSFRRRTQLANLHLRRRRLWMAAGQELTMR